MLTRNEAPEPALDDFGRVDLRKAGRKSQPVITEEKASQSVITEEKATLANFMCHALVGQRTMLACTMLRQW